MNNAIYKQKMRNVKVVHTKKEFLKCTSKPSYMSRKEFDNNLDRIHKIKLALKLNKPAVIRIFIFELGKLLIYKFHDDYIKNRYDKESKLLITDTNSLMQEIKTEDVYEDFSSNKKMLGFSNYSTKSKYYDN